MKSTVKGLLLPLFLAVGFGASAASYAQSSPQTSRSADKDEARQTAPDTPKQAYQRKVREIRAAHRDNLANCKSMDKAERSGCVKEANQILKSDLADAKTGASTSSGESGTSGTGESSKVKESKQ